MLAHILVGQPPLPMRSWNDLERTVLSVVVVEMEPETEERFKQ